MCRIESHVLGALEDDQIMKIIEIFDFPLHINNLVTFCGLFVSAIISLKPNNFSYFILIS